MAKEKFNLNEITIGGVNQKELTNFTRQFSTLQNAGLNTLRSLEILMNMLKPGVLKKSIKKIREEVEQGVTLSDAMSRQPKAFDLLYVNMVKAGEAGGVLDKILSRLADFREKSQKIASEIKTAMIYPIAVIVIATLIVAGIIWAIVPKFKEMFADMGIELPKITQILFSISDSLEESWWIPLAVIGGIFAIYRGIYATAKGQLYIDFFKMYLPIFGPIIRKSAISRFSRTLGTLLDSGVPLIEGLTILKGAAGNAALADLIDKVSEAVKQGESMVLPLKSSRIFDDMTTSMIEVGDEAGEVSEMLVKVADNFENEIDAQVAGLKALIEPILIVVLGGTVLFIVLALFLPLLSIMNNLGA